MEKLCSSVAKNIGEKMSFDDEKVAVMAYGLLAIMQILSIFAVISAAGLIIGDFFESVTVFLLVGILRKSTGGVHSKTYQGCMVISISSILLLAAIARYSVNIDYSFSSVLLRAVIMIITFIMFLIYFVIIYIKVPVDNERKIIVKKDKIRRLRRSSFLTWGIYLAAALLFIWFSYINSHFLCIGISIALATTWQVFTLTKAGNKIITFIDSKIKPIKK